MPAAYLKMILQAAGAASLPPAALLAGTALDAETLQHSDRPVAFDATLSVLRNAERLLGAGWHLDVGQRLTAPAHGPLGFAVITAPDLGASLRVLLRFMEIRAPFLWATGSVEGEQFVFRFFESVDMGDQRQTLVELSALSLQGLVERPLGRELTGAVLSFAYAEPTYIDALARTFHAERIYGAKHHSLRLPKSWLAQPCALHDAPMHRYLLARCEEELAMGAGGLSGEIAVRQALLARPGSLPGLVEVAAGQHISPRTLIRRLKREGTAFSTIRDDVRRTLARDLLMNSEFGIGEIAERLGYQDPSNFSRAFRRWWGQSPAAFRKARGEAERP